MQSIGIQVISTKIENADRKWNWWLSCMICSRPKHEYYVQKPRSKLKKLIQITVCTCTKFYNHITPFQDTHVKYFTESIK